MEGLIGIPKPAVLILLMAVGYFLSTRTAIRTDDGSTPRFLGETLSVPSPARIRRLTLQAVEQVLKKWCKADCCLKVDVECVLALEGQSIRHQALSFLYWLKAIKILTNIIFAIVIGGAFGMAFLPGLGLSPVTVLACYAFASLILLDVCICLRLQFVVREYE